MTDCGGCTNFETIKPRPPTAKEEREIAENILRAMNVGQCKTASTGVAVSTNILGAKGSASATASFALGCEQLTVLVNQYHESKSKMTQIMNCVCRTVGSDITSRINIKVRFINSDIEVPGEISIVTESVIKLLSETAISDQVVNEISSITKTMLDTTVDVLQKSVNDVGAPQSTQRLIGDIRTNISSDSYMRNINNSVTQIMNKITNDKDILLEIIGTRVRASSIIIRANTLLELTAQNILNATLTSLMQQEEVIDVTTSIKAVQEQENKGLAAAQLAGMSGGSASIWAIIGGIILLIILLPILLGVSISGTQAPWYRSVMLLVGLIVFMVLFISIGVATSIMHSRLGNKTLERREDGSVKVDEFKKFVEVNDLDIDVKSIDANADGVLNATELKPVNKDINKHNDTIKRRRKILMIASITAFSLGAICLLMVIIIIMLRVKYPTTVKQKEISKQVSRK